MTEQQHNQASKAEVQTTKLNKMPAANQEDTEFSVEPAGEAAEAFQQNQRTAADMGHTEFGSEEELSGEEQCRELE